jgi:Domain of unknown function (DUF4386)
MRDQGRRVGLVYLVYFVLAILAGGFLGSGHAIIGTSIEVVSYVWYGLLTLVLCRLFLGVNRGVAGVAIAASWIGCALGILKLLHVPGAGLDPLLFFGIFCVLLGYLVYSSTLLPRTLGVVLALAGLGWLVLTTVHPHAIAAYIQGLGIVAEIALMLWLLAFGLRPIRT